MKKRKIVTIVGARPQFIKAAAVSRVIRAQSEEVLVHTGQHYDYGMSEVFFRELDIPEPQYNLGVGSKLHGAQTGEMLAGIEKILLHERPMMVLVYGDTNSTLAGALAAAKLHIPVAHVEAGLRSYRKTMPEEVNRVLTDHMSALLFAPTARAVENLSRESIVTGVSLTGDVMCDALRFYQARAKDTSILERLSLTPRGYVLATIHRAENTDSPDRLREILTALGSSEKPVVLPLHPRTSRIVEETSCGALLTGLCVIEPAGYLEMLQLERSALAVVTDSGGVQKEAYLFGVPCITVRDETEWVETVANGANTLTGASREKIVAALSQAAIPAAPYPEVYGRGDAAALIAGQMERFLDSPG